MNELYFSKMELIDAIYVSKKLPKWHVDAIVSDGGSACAEKRAVENYTAPGMSFSAIANGEIVAVGGLFQDTATRMTAWGQSVEGMRKRYWIEIMGFYRKLFDSILSADTGVIRIQAYVPENIPKAGDFISRKEMDFVLEGKLVSYGLGGEDFLLYSRTRGKDEK